jgi:hypothetical protein
MLINRGDVTKQCEQISNSASSEDDSIQLAFSGRGHQVIKDVIGYIKQNQTIHYCSDGHWSAHELLEYLLQVTGPAKVYLTTWAMSENPVRSIVNMIDAGRITELNCVFDLKTQDRAPKVFQLMNSIVTRVKLAHCHAKIFVIENDEWLIANNGSANWTKNPRFEAGILTSNKQIASFYRDCIIKKLETGKDQDDTK